MAIYYAKNMFTILNSLRLNSKKRLMNKVHFNRDIECFPKDNVTLSTLNKLIALLNNIPREGLSEVSKVIYLYNHYLYININIVI